MSSLTLTPTNALASALNSSRSSVAIAVLDGLSIAHVAARKGQGAALAARVKELYGVTLPQTPRIATGSNVSFVWAGPEQWLAMARISTNPDFERDLRGKLEGLASVADQTDARALATVRGPSARHVLAKGVPIDLHPKAFPAGSAAITHASHIGVLMWLSEADDTFTLACPRSYASSFWGWLTESAVEFSPAVGG